LRYAKEIEQALRPSLSLSQIDWRPEQVEFLIDLAHSTGWLTSDGERIRRAALSNLRAMRAELNKEDDGG